jgi:glycerophosphoryl diester phosphodiesterase
MKKIFVILMCVFVSACQTENNGSDAIAEIREKILDPNKGISVIAHRACWQNAPENSLLAIERCIAAGVDIIEIDIRATRDGHLVLLHDKTLDRTTDGTGVLSEKTLSEIKKLKLFNRDGKVSKSQLTALSIPTLKEVLSLTRGKVILNLDIKDDLIAQKAFDIVDSMDMGAQILVKLREYPDSERLKNYRLPKNSMFMPIVVQCGPRQGVCVNKLSDIVPHYAKFDPVAFELVFNDFSFVEEGVGSITAINKRVWVNTMFAELSAGYTDEKAEFDPDSIWGVLFSNGVNMIQTDKPTHLLEYVQQDGR